MHHTEELGAVRYGSGSISIERCVKRQKLETHKKGGKVYAVRSSLVGHMIYVKFVL